MTTQSMGERLNDFEEFARRKQYRYYLESELEAATLYSALADLEWDNARGEVFNRLARAEMLHATRWAEKLGVDPQDLEPKPLGVQGSLMKIGAKFFGTRRMLSLLLRFETKEVKIHSTDPETESVLGQGRRHSRVLRGLIGPRHADLIGFSGGVLGSSGSLRAAVLGVNDGLVSNFSLVMGVAGGTGNDPHFVLLAGVAGLLAGAFSMAAGEYVSMRSQREVYEHEIRKEEVELREWPDEEKKELMFIYQAKGLSEQESDIVAERLMTDPQVALDTMVREGLGLDPSQLGSPWGASLSSFISFVAGASVPIVPYVFYAENLALSLSAVLSAVSLAGVGGLLAIISGRNMMWGALRMFLVGGTVAAVTFGVGSLIGVSVS